MTSILNYLTLSDPSYPVRPRHIAYYEYGDTKNPNIILCVHGLSRNGLDFEPLAQSLSAEYRILCPDMAGRGKSDWLENKSDYNYTTYVSDVMALIAHLKISRLDWIGTSMGGIIGMMIAAGYPPMIKRLILNDIGMTVASGGLKRIVGYVGTSRIFASAEEAESYMKSTFITFGLSTPEEWKILFDTSFNKLADGRYALKYDPDISQPFRAMASSNDEIKDIDLSNLWNMITCPALILRGETSDILTRKTAEAMQSSRPDVMLVEFAATGHAPALINSHQIKTITDWLDIKA